MFDSCLQFSIGIHNAQDVRVGDVDAVRRGFIVKQALDSYSPTSREKYNSQGRLLTLEEEGGELGS
ncbi:hypothetical protein PM082_011014 [Marasmius tenuissimus]|nr:hypothetical protein PM082_011014 [Marasmius tenuissimus]